MTALFFPIAALLIDILIMIMFFSKKNIVNKETKLYSYLLIVNFIECLLNVFGITFVIIGGNLAVFSLLQKIDMVMMIMWACLMFFYVYNVSDFNKKTDLVKKNSFIMTIIFSLLTFILPCKPIIEGDSINSSGLSPDCAYITIAIFALGIIICVILSIIKNKENIKNKKYFPLYALILLAILGLFLRSQIPSVIFEPFVMGYVILMMYHTIENPDIKMLEEVKIAKEQAEKANNAKTDFLSSMSHEIRTPLNAIVGFSQALMEENIPETAKEEVEDIMSASETLLELVNSILDISKIEANKIKIIEKEYSFKEIFDDLISLTKVRMGEKPLEFNCYYDNSIPPVLYGDNVRVKQIILNLLTNSVKYTKEGFIDFKVSSFKKDGVCRLIISVEDSGIGIKKENLDKLFKKFERFDEKNTTIEGTGLGLAITQKLVDLMNGKIVVQSIHGKGSKFTVIVDQKIVIGKTSLEPVIENKSNVKVDLTSKRILLVDDNNLNIKVASRLLSTYKMQIDTCLSGFECIDKINAGEKYDLILLDDMMPKMSGVETLQKLKQIDSFNIPTVALTANAITGMREKYLANGFDDYLSKPIEKPELNCVIEKFLNK